MLRKEDPVLTTYQVGNIQVAGAWAMPHQRQFTGPQIDVHFMQVGIFTEHAERCRSELVTLLADYPQPERLAQGLSYIELGGVLGDQGLALCLLALGEFLGFWQVITPAVLGITGADADVLAGGGMVMASGYRPAPSGVTPPAVGPA